MKKMMKTHHSPIYCKICRKTIERHRLPPVNRRAEAGAYAISTSSGSVGMATQTRSIVKGGRLEFLGN